MNDLTGQKFNRLAGIKPISKIQNGDIVWLFKCDCGNEHEAIGANVIRGQTKSCGCLRIEKTRLRFTTHKQRNTRIYLIWRNMLDRCNNKNSTSYKDYGGRDKPITVCDRWDINKGGSFENFYADVGNPPKGKSLDRINNNKGYNPNNWKWSTNKQQNRNMRSNKNHIFNGKTQCLMDWANEYRINYSTLWARIYKYGYTIEKALMTPIKETR